MREGSPEIEPVPLARDEPHKVPAHAANKQENASLDFGAGGGGFIVAAPYSFLVLLLQCPFVCLFVLYAVCCCWSGRDLMIPTFERVEGGTSLHMSCGVVTHSATVDLPSMGLPHF